uniref:3-mercaptopyruvate sulfurtransferase n=1 Tax=Magallana gigas TaxID=29159 RepID=K1RDC1_MAGGI
MSNDMFVSCQWLKNRIANRHLFQNLVILDVSWASDKNMEDEFLREHIPGAQFFNIMDDNHTDMYPRNLPSVENFQSRARAIGINNDSHLVLYSKSQHGGLFVSGRAWWTFSLISLEIGEFSTNVRGNLRVEFDEMVQIVKTHGQIIDSRASDKLNLKVLTEKGVNLNQPTVCYCNSGMSSCSVVMAITYCGGQARLYSGGYNEWKRKT